MDVFRPPPMPIFLCASLGTGMLLLFVLMGVPAGYFGANTYKHLKGTEWKTATILTATLYPGIVIGIFFILNFFVWGQGSSGAIPFTTMFVLLLMWFGISVPLVFLGAFFGFKAKLNDPPVRTNEIPRQIPQQSWYMSGLFNLLITCAEISIVLCYFQLCNEDYNWWWRAFLTAGSSGLYLFAYSILYFFTQLEIVGFVPTLIYFTYMFVFALLFFLITGTIGFFACYQFVWVIYGAIKVD